MKRFLRNYTILVLVITLAAPSGAVFASEGSVTGSSSDDTATVVEKKDPALSDTPVISLSGQDVPKPSATTMQPLADTTGTSAVVSQPKSEPAKVAVTPEATLQTTPTQALSQQTPIPTQPAPVYATDDVVVSAFRLHHTNGLQFIEIHNTTSEYVSLNGMEVQVSYATETTDFECRIPLDGYIKPVSYLTYATLQISTQETYPLDGCPSPQESIDAMTIQVRRDGSVVESVRAPLIQASVASNQWERGGWSATYRSGVFAKDFKQSSRSAFTSSLYQPPEAPSIQILEVYVRPELCMNGDRAPLCHSYIKIRNTGNKAIDLSLYRLRGGNPITKSTTSNTSQLAGSVEPGKTTILNADSSSQPLKLHQTEGTVWFEDALGFTNYPSRVTPYLGADRAANTGKSWAYDVRDNTWKWATPSPDNSTNNFIEAIAKTTKVNTSIEKTLQPCRDDQYRSPETNRCRLLATAQTTLAACKEGQYRSLETNRCRSSTAAMTASSLRPCSDTQYRNPVTNRCKSIATAETSHKACAAGQERNPVTNRCRKISASSGTAKFAVEPVKQTATNFIGWWFIGGGIALAAAYATWEWRHEIRRLITKVFQAFSRTK